MKQPRSMMWRIGIVSFLMFFDLRAVPIAQQRSGLIVQDAPLLLLPDRAREPLLIMKKGVRVRVKAAEGDWYIVIVDGTSQGDRTGYVEATFVRLLDFPGESNEPTPSVALNQQRNSSASRPPSNGSRAGTARITTLAPMYSRPVARDGPMLLLERDVVITVLRVDGPWLTISVEGSRTGTRVGYIEQQYVELLPTIANSSSAAAISAARRADPTNRAPAAQPISPTSSGAPVSTPPPSPVSQSASSVRLKDFTIRGYVTEVRSPSDFDIEDYRITRDNGFTLDFENADPHVTFKLQDVRVGVELEIKGLLNEQTGELKAKHITVDLEQFKTIKQTAFVSQAPEGIQLLDGSWAGDLHADGQTIRVTKATKVLFKPTKREARLAKVKSKGVGASDDKEEFESLKTLDDVQVGMAMAYEGRRDRETGIVIADRIEFSSNDLEDGEARLWNSLKASVKEPQGFQPGELKINHVGKFKLLPDENVQRYVTQIGQSLVPAYQRDLSANDPRKIPFQYHVVQTDEVNAFATPNGIVVVYSGLLELLDNEAQLAAAVGHEMAHATHEHTWRQEQYHKKTRIGIALAGAVASAYGMRSLADLASLVNGAIVNGHQRVLENQSDRIGLEYMYAAGYDVREAPAVWKLMAARHGVSSTNFFWSDHDNEPTRRSYLMNELKNNYRDVDFSRLRTNREDFSRMKAAVTAAKTHKRKLQVS